MSAPSESSVPQILFVAAPSENRWAERIKYELLPRLPGVEIRSFDEPYSFGESITSEGDDLGERLKVAGDFADVIVMIVTEAFMASPILTFVIDQLSGFKESPLPSPVITWVLAEGIPWEQTPLRDYQAALSPDEPLVAMSEKRWHYAMDLLAESLTKLRSMEVLPSDVQDANAFESPPASPPGTRTFSPPTEADASTGRVGSPPSTSSPAPQIFSPPTVSGPDTAVVGSPPFLSPPAQPTPSADFKAPASPPYSPSGASWSPSFPFSTPSAAYAGMRVSPPLSESPPRDDATASRAAGFRPDSVKGEDRLNVRSEALTLAMVLAHKDVEPPISVGLFGDWGSGKSFFMREMRKLVDGLSRRSQGGKGRFCENVVQLEFNAWHYMDSDLWASLAREIFEGLATAVADREKPDLDLERERLRVATQSTKDLIAATEVRIEEVQRRMDDTRRQLNSVQQERSSVEDVAAATVVAVLETPVIEKQLREVAGQLGINEVTQSVAELKGQVVDLSTIGRRAKALVAGVKERWLGLLLGLVFSAALWFVLHKALEGYSSDIATLAPRIAALLGVVTAALATVGRTAKAILERAEAFKKSLDEKLNREREAREGEVLAKQKWLDEERRKLEQQWERQKKEMERLKTLSRQLEELNSSRQLVDFIRARDASSDYRGKLGTVARASQDFKQLSDLMARAALARQRVASNQKTEQDEEDAKLPQIDRIVLYIDDLDRCPTDKVVDVLQAVHLLLAYPLFVVVVGVDPRWLLHSLEEHTGAFRLSEDSDFDGQNQEWRSTSLNYLEKIFQIPYTLRPMSFDGFAGLVNDLSGSKSTKDGFVSTLSGSPSSSISLGRRTGSPSVSRAFASPPVVSPPLERRGISAAPSSPGITPSISGVVSATSPQHRDMLDDLSLDPNPGALELDAREREFMTQLYALIPTPRAAKRFVNVYRLIRASITSEYELRWFLEQREFVSVQVLLAMVTGTPAEASEILRKLLALPTQAPWTVKWWDIVDGVVKEGGDTPSWNSFAIRLRSLRDSGEVPETCEGFRKWADDVARYSFYSGRVLLGPQIASATVSQPESLS